MKKYFFILVCLLIASSACQAQNVNGTQIIFQVGFFDPVGTNNQDPKSPVNTPAVYLEDYTLTFTANHPEYVLYIKDESDTVVYSTVVSSVQTTVVLPSYLSGSYEIELVFSNWLFYGIIDL